MINKKNGLIITTLCFALFGSSGCSQKKDLTIKPYPHKLNSAESVIFNNKQYWQVDLEDSIKEFKDFEANTFTDIDIFKNRYSVMYKRKMDKKREKQKAIYKQEKRMEREKLREKNSINSNDDYYGILNEQYK